MAKKSVWMCIFTLLTVAWLAFAIPYAHSHAAGAKIERVKIELTDPDSRFLNGADIRVAFGLDGDSIIGTPVAQCNLHDLENALNASDQIEWANANILTDGTLHLQVAPMVPVARVFEPGIPSYYINADGKRISAQLRHHLDVPVLTGHFDSVHPAHRLLPLLDYIATHPLASDLVAGVDQQADGNIIIIPTIVGHVVNFGDTSIVDDKFRRLATFYRTVAPSRGWNCYDTVAVRWRGQIVATRRDRTMPPPILPTVEEQYGTYDETDIQTISVDDDEQP